MRFFTWRVRPIILAETRFPRSPCGGRSRGCRSDPSRSSSTSSDAAARARRGAASKYITTAIFEGGTDYIGHPETDEEVRKTYDGFVTEGWIRMTPEDIRACAGVEVPQLTQAA